MKAKRKITFILHRLIYTKYQTSESRTYDIKVPYNNEKKETYDFEIYPKLML